MSGGPDPARQSLARAITPAERALADALEAIYASGCHDFPKVVEQLNGRDVALPSGAAGPWTVDILESELRSINVSFDAAYEAGGSTPA